MPPGSGRAWSAVAGHPTLLEVVRAATAATGAEVDLVVFDGERCFVLAGLGSLVLQPRLPTAAESLVRERGGAHAAADGTTSFTVRDADGQPVGALTVRADLDGPTSDAVAALARIATGVLSERTNRPATGFHEQLIDHLRDVVVVLDEHFVVAYASRSTSNLLGRSPAELTGTAALDLVHPDDVETTVEALARLRTGREVYTTVVRLLHGGGGYEPVEVTGREAGAGLCPGGTVLSLRAATGRETGLEHSLDRISRLSATVLEQLQDGIVAIDAFGDITVVNEAARRIFGLAPEPGAGELTIDDLPLLDLSVTPLERGHHPLDRIRRQPDLVDDEVLVVEPGGTTRHLVVSGRQVHGDDGTLIGAVLAFHDVTTARRAERELTARALHDQLTGLPNRRHLTEWILDVSRDPALDNLTVCFVDLDAFKLVNDTHGHGTGDVLVRSAARRLRRVLRSGDLLARLGGDEFVAVVPDADPDEVLELAERLRRTCGEPFAIDGRTFTVSASVGVATMHAPGIDADVLMRRADLALYAAKDRGRNRVEVFTDGLARSAEIEQRQRELLRDAIDGGGLTMHYQPVADALTDQIVGFESLARCRTRSGTIVGPSEFLDAVTGSGLVWELDRTAFEQSCRAAATLARARPDLHLFVACNLSSISLRQPDLVDELTDAIGRNGVDPRRLVVEITESAAFDVGPAGPAALTRLHDTGVRLALDDFGTGYSSLAHLLQLPLDIVKVDRSFVSDLATVSPHRAIATTIVDLATQLGFETVAEGVETPHQLEAVRHLGFDHYQGWLRSPAVELEDAIELLAEERTPTPAVSW